jgi:hypothetical protein
MEDSRVKDSGRVRGVREIEPSRAESILKELLTQRPLTEVDRTWFILGHTYAKDEVFEQLRSVKNVTLVTLAKPNFGWFRYIPLPKPRFFMMDIHSEVKLEALSDVLFDLSIFEVIVFDERFRTNFVAEAEAAVQLQEWRSLKNDDGLFIYGLDTDNSQPSTGFLEVVECRKNTPPVFAKFCCTL